MIIGVNERGEKHFLAIEDGVRESTQSWREVLLKLKSRGMNVPQLAVGDGAMGFWAALEEVLSNNPTTAVLDAQNDERTELPAEVAPAKAKQALHEIWQANTREDAEKAFDLFLVTYEPKYPKAALCLAKDREELMAFYDFRHNTGRVYGRATRLNRPSAPFAIAPSDRRLPDTGWDAAYDVQVGPVCTEELAAPTRFVYLAKVITE